MAENPLNILKRSIRESLRQSGAEPTEVSAIVAFVECAYYTDNKIGDPEYHQRLAKKAGLRVGFSELDLQRIEQQAQSLCLRYRQMIKSGGSLDMKAIQRSEAEFRRIKELKGRMRDRFERMMSVSDDQLRIKNSNQRVAFMEDPIYRMVGSEDKKDFRGRVFKEEGYMRKVDELRRLRESDQLVAVDIKKRDEIDWEALEIRVRKGIEALVGMDILEKAKAVYQERFIMMVLRGEIVTASVLGVYGFSPDDICSQARSYYSLHRFETEEARRVRLNAIRRGIWRVEPRIDGRL